MNTLTAFEIFLVVLTIYNLRVNVKELISPEYDDTLFDMRLTGAVVIADLFYLYLILFKKDSMEFWTILSMTFCLGVFRLYVQMKKEL